MEFEEFVRRVQERAHLATPQEAELTAFVVLALLGERISGGEADDLYERLPEPLRTQLRVRVPRDKPARRMTADEYVERVAEELGVARDEAERRIRRVFDVVRKVVDPDEFDDVLSQLDATFRGLVAPRAP